MKPPKKTKAQLRRRILELEAQQASAYHFADASLHKTVCQIGGGVLLQLTALGGDELITPVVIRDGLSPETVAAIQKDLARSYELATLWKPKS